MSEEHEECMEHAGRCGDGFRPTKPYCPDCLRARITALESSLRERDERVKAMEKIVTEARYEMATHGEHCDCGTCAAFYELDYPEKPTLSPAPAAKEDAH